MMYFQEQSQWTDCSVQKKAMSPLKYVVQEYVARGTSQHQVKEGRGEWLPVTILILTLYTL